MEFLGSVVFKPAGFIGFHTVTDNRATPVRMLHEMVAAFRLKDSNARALQRSMTSRPRSRGNRGMFRR